ncbi:MAG: ABC transporter ATP-binding protein [Dehalococcoidia bacterium]|nr:ABC transporter ATP-binding protein [Dehalococcoidia bacterium]
MIRLERITKTYPMGNRELTVLHGIEFNIKPREMVAIMGPSGSGKSTTLNILGCLDTPSSGSYYLDGRDVSKLNRHELATVRSQKIGFVFQSYNLLPRMSALENVKLGLKYAGIHDGSLAQEALARVGLADRAGHKPTEMSGGEQQRVAIARALAKNPPVILADEPTGNLDSRSSADIMDMLVALHKEQGNTLIMITHEPDMASYCERIIHLKDGLVKSEETL